MALDASVEVLEKGESLLNQVVRQGEAQDLFGNPMVWNYSQWATQLQPFSAFFSLQKDPTQFLKSYLALGSADSSASTSASPHSVLSLGETVNLADFSSIGEFTMLEGAPIFLSIAIHITPTSFTFRFLHHTTFSIFSSKSELGKMIKERFAKVNYSQCLRMFPTGRNFTESKAWSWSSWLAKAFLL